MQHLLDQPMNNHKNNSSLPGDIKAFGEEDDRMEEKTRETEGESQSKAHMRRMADGLQAHRAWFSNLAPGLMSLFIQLQYQTFPFPARRSPL